MFLKTGLFQERFTTFATRVTTFNVDFHVSVQIELEDESFFALRTSMGAASFVDHQVLGKMSFLEESFATSRADVRSLSRMPHVMFLEQLASTEFLSANIAFMRLFSTMNT